MFTCLKSIESDQKKTLHKNVYVSKVLLEYLKIVYIMLYPVEEILSREGKFTWVRLFIFWSLGEMWL